MSPFYDKVNADCTVCLVDPYLIYCSDLLYFFARYLAEALLGILTKESSLLYLVMLHGVSHTQTSLSLSTRKSAARKTRPQRDLFNGSVPLKDVTR